MSGTKPISPRPDDAIDSITVEVIRGFLETVADEMSLTMKRTAVTPIFSESSDYSCAVKGPSLILDASWRARSSLHCPSSHRFCGFYRTIGILGGVKQMAQGRSHLIASDHGCQALEVGCREGFSTARLKL